MAAARHFPSPSPSPSPSPLPWFSLVCRLVVVSTPPPLVLSTLPPPEPLPINSPLPLVRWCISSRLPLFAGWLSRRLLSRRLRRALPFVAQPPLASILDPPSLFAPALHLLSCHLRLASPFVAQSPLASILDPPSLFTPAGWCVASCRTASASRRAAGSRVASCGSFALYSPACPLLHCHFCRPLSRRRGHRRHPQMHGALSRRRHCQQPLFPLVRLSSSNTSACAAALSSLQLNHPCPTLVIPLSLASIPLAR
jgi:hypothetical protein